MSGEMEARARALRERNQQEHAPAWDFNEIPEITGIVESIQRITLEGKERIVATVAEVEGPVDARKRWGVWLSQAALLNRFRELRIVEGELVSIRYRGESEHREPGKSPAKLFSVSVDRVGGSFSWGDEGGRATGPVDDGAALTREEHERLVDAAREEEERRARGDDHERYDPANEPIPY